MSAPRVLVVATVLGRGPSGVQRHAAEILPRAAALLASRGGALALLEGAERCTFALPPDMQRIASRAPFAPPLARWRAERRALAAALDAARRVGAPFQVVHQGHLPFATAPVSARGAEPVWLVHDLRRLRARSPLRAALQRRVVGAAARGARRVVTVSEAVRAELLAAFPALAGRVDVAPNGADHLPLVARAPAGERFLLGVGHIEARKDWETALRALALDASLPPLWLVGAAHGAAGAREAKRLDALAHELGVAARWRWRGAVGDAELAALYARATAVVLPSRLEGFSIPAAEARRVGAPLVASAIAAHREVAGDVARLFPVGDAAALARELAAALAAPAPAPREPTRWSDAAERLVDAWTRAATPR